MKNIIENQFVVNHQEAAQLIATNGHEVTFKVLGEPGIGKSSILKSMEKMLGADYDYIYVDLPNKDIPNIALAMPDHERKVTADFPHELWLGSDRNKPKVIMLDEEDKATDYVKLMINRLKHERIIGDLKLPDGSIVLSTSNLQSDGVGDRSNAHSNNREIELVMRKPTRDEWMAWAINNGINSDILAWCSQDESLFLSYTELDEVNASDVNSPVHYIFHPQYNTRRFVSPRSLEYASSVLNNSIGKLSRDLITKALVGTFGKNAAMALESYVALGMELPPISEIIAKPSETKIPEDGMAKLVLTYRFVTATKDSNEVDAFMTYMKRFNQPELICTYIRSCLVGSTSLGDLMATNRQVTEYVGRDDDGKFLWSGK